MLLKISTKSLRIICSALILAILIVSLLISDTFVTKFHPQKQPLCILCALHGNFSLNNSSELLHFNILLPNTVEVEYINVIVFFVHFHQNPRLKEKFSQCVSSLFQHTTSPLHLHVITDDRSVAFAVEALRQSAPLAKTEILVSAYDVNKFINPLQHLIKVWRKHFSFKNDAYYSDGLFYISIGFYRVMKLQKVILIDADVKFLEDVTLLYKLFEEFPEDAMIGIAREQQPVYRHILMEYRRLHNGTNVGGPPPDGVTGFNSGVLLLNLEQMRNSLLYNELVNNSTIITQLAEKYKFKGHLGDQDYYSLINLEYSSLFYVLPCTWNRQLCQWWKHHGYVKVFDSYNECHGKINLMHGNCNTIIPNM